MKKSELTAELKQIFAPNGVIKVNTRAVMITFQVIFALFWWAYFASAFVPKPTDVLRALGSLLSDQDVIREIFTSVGLCMESMAISVIFSLLLSYAARMPFFRPVSFIFTKGRFLSLTGLQFVFLLAVNGDGHDLKIMMLVFGISVFFTTSMLAVIRDILKEDYDYARSLRLGEWRVLLEVVVLKRLGDVFEVTRQTFAMAWMMLTMVEGIARAEGGIGKMMLDQNKHFQLDQMFALQIVILVIGISADYLLGFAKNTICPWTTFKTSK